MTRHSDLIGNIVVSLMMGTVIFAVIAINVAALRRDRNGEWHAFRGKRWRRYVNGAWQYRPMTEAEHDEELSDFQDRNAW